MGEARNGGARPNGGAPPWSGAPDFDIRRLREFLVGRIDGAAGGMGVARVAGGQSNPTYFVDFVDRRLVLRQRPPGNLLPSAHAIDREFRVLAALADTAVPVPRPLLYYGEDDVIGTAFYVMERVPGRVFHDAALPRLGAADRAAIYASAADTLAALHAVDPAAVGLSDFGRPAGYWGRQIARWSKQWQLSKGSEDLPDLDFLGRWLAENSPPDSPRATIAHGDYRLGNLMIHPVEPRVVAVLDWELATLGEPLADLSHMAAFTWRMRPEEYGGVAGLEGVLPGLPDEAAFFARYAAAAPGAGPVAPFHLAFALYRAAVIFAGIAARARSGNAAAGNAEKVGRLAAPLAARAASIARQGL